MAEFSSLVITENGQALMAKLIAHQAVCNFTAIKASSTAYTQEQLQTLTAMTDIKQSCDISSITVVDGVSVNIKGALNNNALDTGYTVNTIGLYAVDPADACEILYAVARATTAGYMPAYNGITSSGVIFDLVVTVGNAENVSITVNQAAFATQSDIISINNNVSDIKGYIGYTDTDIYGVEVDFENNHFARLAGASDLTEGADFDNLLPWQRRRCIVTHDGAVLAYHGDAAYTDNGYLLQEVIHPDIMGAYPIGTPVNVMIEQQPFYYKVVPLKLGKVGDNYAIRKARYYISATPKPGFDLHPAFCNGDYPIYLSAYESTLYDTVSGEYETAVNLSNTIDVSTCTLSSIAGGNVLLSTRTFSDDCNADDAMAIMLSLLRNCDLQSEVVLEATQLLILIEYASFNTRQCLPVSGTVLGYTGATSSLGNASGSVNGGVSYRGEEGLWNSWHYYCGGNVSQVVSTGYISAYTYLDDTSMAGRNSLFSAVCESNGTSNAPIGDMVTPRGVGCDIYHGGNNAGLFAVSRDANTSIYTRRFCYVGQSRNNILV